MADTVQKSSGSVVRHADGKMRCAWCGDDPLYVAYHDEEWGRPLHDDARLFEMLCLEGAQAGLSWITVLRKRDNYRAAFHHFDAEKIARFGVRDRRRLMNDAGIIRNRLKIEACIGNAKAYLALRQRDGDFDRFLWRFVGQRSARRRPVLLTDNRSSSPQSDAMSKELKRCGFKFVGTTICYAFMQATGMVDDHQRNCWAAGKM
jgi:DNA-3-methyladenine glycosylase I